MHSFLSLAHIGRNAVFLGAEAFAAGALVFLGAGCAALAGTTSYYAAVGFGLAALFLTSMLLKRTGAMLTPGGAMLRGMLWMTNVEKRNYSAPKYQKEDYLYYLIADMAMMLMTIGVHIGGAFIGVLLLNEIDKSGLLTASVSTKPFGQLAGKEETSLLGAWVLNSLVLAAYAATTGHYSTKFVGQKGKVVRLPWVSLIKAPLAIGFAVFTSVFVSYIFGVGTVLNFAADLALAVIVPSSISKLWISAVGQITGALTIFVAAFLVNYVDYYYRRAKHHHHHHHDTHGRHETVDELLHDAMAAAPIVIAPPSELYK